MNQSPYIVDVDQHNIQDLIQQSLQVPVLLDFWASWCEPCKALAPVLSKLADEYKGRFILAKVDTDANPMLSQQLGVRSIPSLKLIAKGQLAGELNGAQPEGEIRRLLEPFLAEAPEEQEQDEAEDDAFLEQVQRARAMGAYDQALEALQAALQELPDRTDLQILMVDVLLDMDRLDDAQQVLDAIQDEKQKAEAEGRLYFLREIQGFESAESLQYRVATNDKDVEARYFLAVNCILAGEFEAAMELLLRVIQLDRSFKEDGGRLALLKLFDMLGPEDPRVATYRRRLFASLH